MASAISVSGLGGKAGGKPAAAGVVT